MSQESGSQDSLHDESSSSPPSEPSKEPAGATLKDAINTAPVEQLRAMLRDFVEKHADIKEAVTKRLLTPMSPAPGVHTLKRKAYETCRHCDQDYAVVENIDGACVYHKGEGGLSVYTSSTDGFKGVREPDYDSGVFVDCYEEWEEPDPDDEEFEHGFMWTCCDQHQPAAGCIATKHVPISADELRMRPKARRA